LLFSIVAVDNAWMRCRARGCALFHIQEDRHPLKVAGLNYQQ